MSTAYFVEIHILFKDSLHHHYYYYNYETNEIFTDTFSKNVCIMNTSEAEDMSAY